MTLTRLLGCVVLWVLVGCLVQASADALSSYSSSGKVAAEDLPLAAASFPSRTAIVRRDFARGIGVAPGDYAHAAVQAGGAIILQQEREETEMRSMHDTLKPHDDTNPNDDPPIPLEDNPPLDPVEEQPDTLLSRKVQRAKAAPEADCTGGWQAGDGLGDSEKQIGSFDDQNTCAQRVKSVCPTANGASYSATTKSCWCEEGQWSLGASTERVNCAFAQLQAPSSKPIWGVETAGRYCSGSWTGDLESRKNTALETCKQSCENEQSCHGIVIGTYQGISDTCVLCTSDSWTTGGQAWATGYEFERGATHKSHDADIGVHDVVNNPPKDPFEETEHEYNVSSEYSKRNPPVSNKTFQEAVTGNSPRDPGNHEETHQEYAAAEQASTRRRADPTQAPLPSPPQYRRPTPFPTFHPTSYAEQHGNYASGKFTAGTKMCPGTTECQFETELKAKHFCDIEPTCTAVIKKVGSGKCEGGLGCFSPRSGTVGTSSSFGGQLWAKQLYTRPALLGAHGGVQGHLDATNAKGEANATAGDAKGAVTRPASVEQGENTSATSGALKLARPHHLS